MSTDVTVRTGGARSYELTSAILLYGTAPGSFEGQDVYATIHAIERHRKGGPRLLPGEPATAEACAAFARSIRDRAAFSGWIAPEILFIGPRITAWWRAPAAASVHFETMHKDKARTLGKRAARTLHPGLVFVLAEGNWHVYAVKGAARPTPATQLWRAPYFNVWKDGRICEGNVERPASVSPATLARFEAAFFGSRFTHPNEQGRLLTRYRGGVYQLWRDLLAGKHAKAFPEKSLVPHGKHTLESLLRAMERGKE